MSGLNDFLSLIAEAKRTDPVAQKARQLETQVKESVKSDLGSLFAQLASISKKVELLPEETQGKAEAQQLIAEVLPEPIKEESQGVEKYLTDKSFQQPNPDVVQPDVKAIQQKIKFLEQWLGKISAHGPGSGEVNLRYLDDVARETIDDGLFLKYNGSTKKFVFATVNANALITNTTYVTTEEYTVQDDDYYIGVNYDGPTTIILPVSDTNGRCLVIKDEDGDAETNPITVQGTVDNDAGGFVLQINNGAIQLIYRNGWRII